MAVVDLISKWSSPEGEDFFSLHGIVCPALSCLAFANAIRVLKNQLIANKFFPAWLHFVRLLLLNYGRDRLIELKIIY
jgi:hypothetical protein